METMTGRRRHRKSRLPLIAAIVLAAGIVVVLAVLVFRSLLPAAQRQEPDPHEGQIYVNDGANMVWLTPHENFAVSPLRRWQFVTLEGHPYYQGSDFATRRGIDLSVFQGMWIGKRRRRTAWRLPSCFLATGATVRACCSRTRCLTSI